MLSYTKKELEVKISLERERVYKDLGIEREDRLFEVLVDNISMIILDGHKEYYYDYAEEEKILILKIDIEIKKDLAIQARDIIWNDYYDCDITQKIKIARVLSYLESEGY